MKNNKNLVNNILLPSISQNNILLVLALVMLRNSVYNKQQFTKVKIRYLVIYR